MKQLLYLRFYHSSRLSGYPQISMLVSLLGLLLAIVILTSLYFGSVQLSFGDFFAALFGRGEPFAQQIIWELRWPRILAAFAAGGLLAFCGAILQTILRNPLAEPYLLGTSSGAAIGALLAIGAGFGSLLTNLCALGGALCFLGFLMAVIGLAKRSLILTRIDYRVILAGVMLTSFGGAIISFILALAPQLQLKGMLFWLLGDLQYVDSGYPLLVFWIAALVIIPFIGSTLNRFTLGLKKARALGTPVFTWMYGLLIVTAIFTTAVVVLAGPIGFIGLVIPHFLRRLGLVDQIPLLLGCLLCGGGYLVICDTMVRVFFTQYGLPVGVVTAFLGAPWMIFLLRSNIPQTN